MRAHKPLSAKWKRKCKVIVQKEAFDLIKPTTQVFPASDLSKTSPQCPRANKNQIFPEVDLTQEHIPFKKYINLPLNYIKRLLKDRWSKLDVYELTQLDLQFIKIKANKYRNQDQPFLSQQVMKSVIIFLEKEGSKKNLELSNKIWLPQVLRKTHSNLQNVTSIRQIQLDLFNYWRQRRSDQGFPLYRLMWKTMDKQDLLFLYRPRNTKRNLRKIDIDIESTVQEVYKQFDQASVICHQVMANQTGQLKKIQTQVQALYRDVKHLISFKQFEKLINIEDLRLSFKEKSKKAQRIQGPQKDLKKNQVLKQVYKPKRNSYGSIVSFLATVMSEIEGSGIQFGNIFPQAIDSSRQTFIQRESLQQRPKEECPFEKKQKSSVKSKSLQPKRSNKSPQTPKERID